MKKLLLGASITLLLLVVAAGIGLSSVGISPFQMGDNLRVLTGLGAKLACSGRYVSQLPTTTLRDDIASYSPALEALTLEYNDDTGTVTASVAGLSKTIAQYRRGLGCTLDIGDTSHLDRIEPPTNPSNLSSQPWPQGALVSTLDPQLQSVLENILVSDNQQGLDTRALLLTHRGEIVAEAYASGFTPQTPLLGWSMGKTLTALMLGNLALNEQLSPEETGLFPAWQGDERAAISIQDLLQMSSGLAFSEVYGGVSDATEMLFFTHNAPAIPKQRKAIHRPGQHFAYSSGTTNLLSQLYVERNGGLQSAIKALHDNLLNPTGMRHTTLEPDPSGVFVGSSYIYASARDWARLGQLMLNDGELNGHRITDPSWIEKMRQTNNSTNDSRYGYQVWLNAGANTSDQHRWPNLPEDTYAFMGNRAQRVMVVPSRDAVIVRLGWSAKGYPDDSNFAEILELVSNTGQSG